MEQLALVRGDVDALTAWARASYSAQLLAALHFLPAPVRRSALQPPVPPPCACPPRHQFSAQPLAIEISGCLGF